MLVDVLSNPTFFSFKKSGANIMIVLCVCVWISVCYQVCVSFFGGVILDFCLAIFMDLQSNLSLHL